MFSSFTLLVADNGKFFPTFLFDAVITTIIKCDQQLIDSPDFLNHIFQMFFLSWTRLTAIMKQPESANYTNLFGDDTSNQKYEPVTLVLIISRHLKKKCYNFCCL